MVDLCRVDIMRRQLDRKFKMQAEGNSDVVDGRPNLQIAQTLPVSRHVLAFAARRWMFSALVEGISKDMLCLLQWVIYKIENSCVWHQAGRF